MATRKTRTRARAEAAETWSVGALYDQPLEALLRPDALLPLLRHLLGSETLLPSVLRLARKEAEHGLAAWRDSSQPLASVVPPPLVARLKTAAGNPDLFRGEWIRELASNEVLEKVMGATLYEVLREFNATVNPFFSSWGLPALLKKAGPLGKLGFFGVSLESGGRLLEGLREEFERQLEPHLKTFLQKTSKAALLRAVAHAQSEENLQAFARLRVRLLEELLQKKLSVLAASFDQARLDRIESELSGWLGAGRDALRQADLETGLKSWLARHGARTVRELLVEAGLEPVQLEEPLTRAWAAALRVILASSLKPVS